MIDDVQRQIAGLSFHDGKSSGAYTYLSIGQPQRPTPQQQTDLGNMPSASHTQTPAYQSPPQPSMSGYTQTPPPYAPSQQAPPYHVPVSSPPFPPPPQHQPHPPVTPEYGQPAYPGWRGPYYGAPPPQPGSMPRPPYTIPSSSPYPPPNQSHQSGYYRQ